MATKKNAKSKVVSYSAIRAEAAKPVAERSFVVKGRDGEMRQPRRYNLTPEAIKKLRKNAGKGFPNPFRPTGIYAGLTQALINLGVDKAHTFVAVKAEIEKVMSAVERGDSTAWDVFANRKPRNETTGKDLNGRIMQTATVLQRLSGAHPYGLKLAQLKACIDILKGDDNQPMYMLHTGFSKADRVRPTNELKGLRRKTKTAKPKTGKKVAKKKTAKKAAKKKTAGKTPAKKAPKTAKK